MTLCFDGISLLDGQEFYKIMEILL
jgi:hypothetical protein